MKRTVAVIPSLKAKAQQTGDPTELERAEQILRRLNTQAERVKMEVASQEQTTAPAGVNESLRNFLRPGTPTEGGVKAPGALSVAPPEGIPQWPPKPLGAFPGLIGPDAQITPLKSNPSAIQRAMPLPSDMDAPQGSQAAKGLGGVADRLRPKTADEALDEALSAAQELNKKLTLPVSPQAELEERSAAEQATIDAIKDQHPAISAGITDNTDEAEARRAITEGIPVEELGLGSGQRANRALDNILANSEAQRAITEGIPVEELGLPGFKEGKFTISPEEAEAAVQRGASRGAQEQVEREHDLVIPEAVAPGEQQRLVDEAAEGVSPESLKNKEFADNLVNTAENSGASDQEKEFASFLAEMGIKKPELFTTENILMMLFFGAPTVLRAHFQSMRQFEAQRFQAAMAHFKSETGSGDVRGRTEERQRLTDIMQAENESDKQLMSNLRVQMGRTFDPDEINALAAQMREAEQRIKERNQKIADVLRGGKGNRQTGDSEDSE